MLHFSSFPLVSVVVPCLNRARYLRETLESIFSQTYPRIECLVMDGGSTDGTIEILRSYEGRLLWHSGPDHGQADAINQGWTRSQGEIVTWLNADDLWLPHSVETMVGCLLNHPEVDVVYGDHQKIDEEGRKGILVRAAPFTLEDLVVRSIFPITQPASLIRRSILERVGMLDLSFPSLFDYELWSRITLRGAEEGRHPFFYLSECLAYARTTSDYRGEDRARECVRIIHKVLTSPTLPLEIRTQHRRAMSHAWIRASWYMRSAKRWRTIRVIGCLLRAFLADSTNALTVWQECCSYWRFVKQQRRSS